MPQDSWKLQFLSCKLLLPSSFCSDLPHSASPAKQFHPEAQLLLLVHLQTRLSSRSFQLSQPACLCLRSCSLYRQAEYKGTNFRAGSLLYLPQRCVSPCGNAGPVLCDSSAPAWGSGVLSLHPQPGSEGRLQMPTTCFWVHCFKK